MPELPEVEFAARLMRRVMTGKKIVHVEAKPSRVVRDQPVARLKRELTGRRVEAVHRHGKYMLVELDGDRGFMCHLGMTGKIVRRKTGEAVRFSRVRFDLENGESLHLADSRMFGRFTLAKASALRNLESVEKLGPDSGANLTAKLLGERIGRTKREVKIALMDQTRLAGIGNIQAAEALWRAKIDPRRPASSLSKAELTALAKGIKASLDFTFELQAEDVDEISYVEEPGAENPFLVYGRAGEPCRRCKTVLRSFTQGGRTTHFCPGCQR